MQKNCAKCNKPFECNTKNISSCDCNKVKLSPKQIEKLKQDYDNCLCLDCLKKL